MNRDCTYAMVVMALVLGVILSCGLVHPTSADASETTIKGELVSIQYGAWVPFGNRKATFVVKDRGGKHHTVYAGMRTNYIPRRQPAIGDKVTVRCIRNRGVWAVTSMTFH